MLPEEVIRKYSATVYRIAFARTGTKADADDIYQEVFLRYIRKLPEFREEEHVKAWFIKVTVNCAKKYMGTRAKKVEFSGGDVGEFLQGNEKNTYTKYGTLEEKLLAEERKAELYREFAALVEQECAMEVALWDERRTTVEAHNILSAHNYHGQKRKNTVDAVAASLILEGYLSYLSHR